MFTDELVEKSQASCKRGNRYQLLPLFIALVFAFTLYPAKAHAQLQGDIEANIPFQFHAGDAKLPAGNYVIRVQDKSDLMVMEISSADGSTSALFEVGEADAHTSPAKTELVFNKYGNSYYLAMIFDQGNPDGAGVVESRYEKSVSKETASGQEHVPAHHRGQQG